MARNVVLVTADSLRADHCGFIDSAADLTPTLDTLADDGVVFEHAIAPGPRTPSSMPATFTGEFMPPVATDGQDYWQTLRRNIRRHLRRHQTLPERMRANGYTTVGFSVNPWTERTGFDRGFDRFYTLNSEFLEGYGSLAFRLADRALRGNPVGERVKWFNKRDWFIRWTDFYDAIRDELDRMTSPYFLWVFLLDTHQPYISPGQFREESSAVSMYYATFRELLRDDADLSRREDAWLREAYRDSVRSVDGFVDSLLGDIEDDEPVLVFHSDHGEGFGAHGSYGHEQALFRENVHVPLLVHDGSARARIPEAVSLRFLPRIVEAVGNPDRFDPGALPAGLAISTTEDAGMRAVGHHRWNFIQSGGTRALYHLQSDPAEQTDVSGDHPDIVEQFGKVLEHHRRAQSEKRRIAEAVEHGPASGLVQAER